MSILKCVLVFEQRYLATILDDWIPGPCGRFTLNCNSYVSFILNSGISFPNQALIEAPSIAIWNRDKIVTAIAASVWFTNVAASIQGKYYPPSFDRPLGMPYEGECFIRYRAGESVLPTILNPLSSSVCSSAHTGTPISKNA